MAFGGIQDERAYGTLNEVISSVFGYDGVSRPNRYEVTLYPPSSSNRVNEFTSVMGEALGDGTVRNMREKKYFETWQRLAYNPQTFAVGYYHDYIGSVDIHTLDEQNNKRYGVQLVEAYPVSINEQALAYATNDTYQTLTVNFAYRYWKNLTDEATLPRPLGERLAERSAATSVRRARASKLGLYGTSY